MQMVPNVSLLEEGGVRQGDDYLRGIRVAGAPRIGEYAFESRVVGPLVPPFKLSPSFGLNFRLAQLAAW